MFSNALFILEIMAAEFLMTFRLKKKEHYILRFIGVFLVGLVVACLIPTIENAWYTCFVYLILFGLTVLGLKVLYAEPWINIIFCGVAAYSTQHFAYQFTNLMFSCILNGASPLLDLYHITVVDISKLDVEAFFWIIMYLIGYFTVYAIVWFLFAQKINKNEDLKIKSQSLTILIAGCLVFNILLNALVVYSNEETTFVNSIVRHTSGAFICLLLLQWQFGLIESKRLQTELEFTKKLLSKAQEQYKISKEHIDWIKLKCHDMKHQIREIGSNKQLDDETIKDLGRSISVYDSVAKSGNDALDVILTEKSFKCLRHNIVLKCIADGQALDFMKSSDVYSLFGNALDNAIEAVIKLQDKEKRVIGLKVRSAGELISVTLKNFYEGELLLDEEGFPDTTKEDKDYHGYGMKSIRMIVEKYDGDVSILTKEGVFYLNVLIPKPNKKPNKN